MPLVEAGARDLGIPVDVLDAVSFLDTAAGAVQIDPLAEGLQVADAEELTATVNADPQGKGWFFKLRLADVKAMDGLMDEAAYMKHIE